jgi:hypothetical protein
LQFAAAPTNPIAIPNCEAAELTESVTIAAAKFRFPTEQGLGKGSERNVER